jgi:hypothetical protein
LVTTYTIGVTMMTMMDTEERQAIIAAAAGTLTHRQGRISDVGNPSRPWFYISVGTRAEATEIREALEYKGFRKEKGDVGGWRYGAYGNDALIALYELLPYMKGYQKLSAELLLDKYGNNGRPWKTEYERIRNTLGNPCGSP